VDSDDDSGENTQSGFTRSSKAKSDF
jgi:hypothetical protein